MANQARDYQLADIDAIFRQWDGGIRSTLGVAATGLGKTFIMASVVKRIQPKRTIFLAHRIELIYQARLAFLEQDIECEIEQGALAASTNLFTRAPVVLAVVQTLNSGAIDNKRMKRFDPMDFDYMLYDEGHLSVAKGNKSIVDYFLNGNPSLKALIVTATPKRTNGEALGQVCQSEAFNQDILWGIDNGWLVEPRQQIVHCGALDFSHIKTTAGDLNSAELAAVMEAEGPAQKIKQATLEAMFDMEENELLKHPPNQWGKELMARRDPRRTIIFTVRVEQAEQLSGIMNRVIPGIANFVHGKTPNHDREHMLKAFKGGDTPCMVNVDVLSTGYDNPFVEIVVMGAPTKSLLKYTQRLGRVTRALPGIVDGWNSKDERLAAIAASAKPFARILDIGGNSGSHKMTRLVDVLGGTITDELKAKVNERIKAEKTPMQIKEVVAEEAEKLRQEVEQRRLAKEAERARLLAKVQYSSTNVSPFDAFDISPPREQGVVDKKLSDGEIKMLVGQRIDPTKLSYAAGKKMFTEVMRRMRSGLASMPQCALIRQHYPELDVKNLQRKRASEILDKLAANKWKRVELDK